MTDLIQMPAALFLAQTPTGGGATPGTTAPAPGPVEVVGVPGATPARTQGAPAGATGTTSADGSPAAPVPPQPGFNLTTLMLPLGVVVVVFWLISIPQRKEQKKLDELRKNLSKNDRVQTSGGILGTVVEVGEHEVILRVDEASNTRIRFAKAAILHVLNRPNGPGATAEAKPGAAVKAGT